MALFDPTWFTGLQTAATSFATACAGAVGAWLALRRRYSEDSTEIKKDRGEWQWIQSAISEREKALREVEEARDVHTEDVRSIARLEARLEAMAERLKALEEARERQIGACEERVRSLAEQVLDQKLANGRLFMALARVDKPEAERLLLLHLRPGPPGKGDEPP